MTKTYLALTALLLAPFSAHAITWNLNSSNSATCLNGCTAASSSGTAAQTFATAGGPNLNVAAVSTGSTLTAANAGSAASKFGTATLAMYGSNGLGVTAAKFDGTIGSVPDHAFDNDGVATTATNQDGVQYTAGGVSYNTTSDYGTDGAVDAGLFSFANSVKLTDISVGYISGDADISILAYTGALNADGSIPTASAILGKSFSQLLANSWAFIGNYSISATNTAKTINNGLNTTDGTPVSSSYWLISAYTSAAGTNKTGGDTSVNFGNDYFKISSVSGVASTGGNGGSGNTGSVPEPTSLLLLASGMLGWRMNRKSSALAA